MCITNNAKALGIKIDSDCKHEELGTVTVLTLNEKGTLCKVEDKDGDTHDIGVAELELIRRGQACFSDDEEVQEFYENHGKYVVDGPMHLFADGAEMRSTDKSSMTEPPEDEHKRAKKIARYWQIKAERAANRFNELRESLIGMSHHATQLTDATVEANVTELRQLKKKAATLRERFRDAKREVKATTPFWMLQRERDQADLAKTKQELGLKISTIKL